MNTLARTSITFTCSRCREWTSVNLDAPDREICQLLRKCRACADVDVEAAVYAALMDERSVPVVHHPIRNVVLVLLGAVVAVTLACVVYGVSR